MIFAPEGFAAAAAPAVMPVVVTSDTNVAAAKARQVRRNFTGTSRWLRETVRLACFCRIAIETRRRFAHLSALLQLDASGRVDDVALVVEHCARVERVGDTADLVDRGRFDEQAAHDEVGEEDTDCVGSTQPAARPGTVAGGGTNFASDGKAATTAQLFQPVGITVSAAGNVYFTDRFGMVKQLTPQ